MGTKTMSIQKIQKALLEHQEIDDTYVIKFIEIGAEMLSRENYSATKIMDSTHSVRSIIKSFNGRETVASLPGTHRSEKNDSGDFSSRNIKINGNRENIAEEINLIEFPPEDVKLEPPRANKKDSMVMTQRDADEDKFDKIFRCLYYTNQCCSCVIS